MKFYAALLAVGSLSLYNDPMIKQKSEAKIYKRAKQSHKHDEFIIDHTRSIEWLGGVNYDNYHKVLSDMRDLVRNDISKEIYLSVTSFGGASGVGMSFYDTVRSVLKPNLITIGSGDVDSSGLIVFLAGKKRFLTKNTTILLHLAGRTFEGNKRYSTADVDTMLKEDRLKDFQYACVVAENSNGRLNAERVLELMAHNTILTPLEAVNLGIAHKVLD